MDEIVDYSETQSRIGRLLERRWFRLAAIWGAWTLVGLFFTSQILVSSAYMEKRPPLGKVLFMQVSICYLWALATPLVWYLARRYCIERQNWGSRILFHALGGLTLVGLMSSIHFLMFMPFFGRTSEITAFKDFQYVFFNLDRQLSIYWLLILMSHVLNYYNSYRKGRLQAAQLRTELVQAQLEALKMQVHPHFLFNTLHSISALLNKDVGAARSMIMRLGDFLRMTLENAGAQEIPLQQEMEFLNGYLEIERVRFQDRLTTLVNVDPLMLDVPVPNLILQPIVENAMRHAIATHSDCGRIEITVASRNGALRIQVKDNGPGLSLEQNETLLRKGLGLANTRARLERLYGADHLLELTNDPAGGLIVTLEIPRERKTSVNPTLS
jgi:two-component system, LytTR family, sensor kinase